MVPIFREHAIPTASSKPHIVANGPDGAIWFCESGPGKIGRLDLAESSIREFDLPNPACAPIGIAAGSDGAMWFTQSKGHRVGRITMDGQVTEFDLPTPNSGPNGSPAVRMATSGSRRVARIIPAGEVTEFGGFAPGGRMHSGRCRMWRGHGAGNRT